MTKPEVTIIGGGIGGLTTALALQKVGIQCCIFEGAEAIKPVGAGIVMASNAMQIFKQLGIHQAIEAAGNKISCVQITDQELRTLSNTNLHKFENKYGVFNVAIHRADLQALIIREVGHENLFLSKKLVSVQQQEHAINLHFEDGSTHEASILIGADGINSAVRNGLFNAGGIRLANQKCWRGVCNMQLTGKQRHTATEVWGHGKRFGYVQINQQQVYWYAVVSHRLLEDSQPVQEYFHKFNPLCNNIINQTDGSTLFESEIHDLIPLQKWYTRNACLIGDAAHATTPNLGQGACQAVEDAWALAKLFKRQLPIPQLLKQYEKERMSKARAIVAKSRTIGQIAHWENPVMVNMRNRLMKIMPEYLQTKQLEDLFNIAALD